MFTLVRMTVTALERTTTASYSALVLKKVWAVRLRPGRLRIATLCDARLWSENPTSPEPFRGFTVVFVQLVKSRNDLSWDMSSPFTFSLRRRFSRIVLETERTINPLQRLRAYQKHNNLVSKRVHLYIILHYGT
jgi:hypothetical protein